MRCHLLHHHEMSVGIERDVSRARPLDINRYTHHSTAKSQNNGHL